MKSIYGKIFIGFFVSVIISFSIVGVFIINRGEIWIASNISGQLEEMGSVISNEPEIFENLDVVAESMNLNIITYSSDEGIHKSTTFNSKQNNNQYLIDFYNSDDETSSLTNEDIQLYSFKVDSQGETIAVLIEKDISDTALIFRNSIFLAGGLIFLIGSIVFLIISDVIVKPISRLSSAAMELARGNYKVRVKYKGEDEIGTLSNNFNFLASQLGETERTRQRFISEISHEFQTPLTSIQGFTTILKDESLTKEQRERYTDIILFESKRLSNLSKSMLQLTLLEGEDVKLNLSTYSINEQLIRVVDSLQDMAEEKNIEIVLNVPNKDIMVYGDQERLEQVWINLINNAIKYTNEEGYISVNLKKNLSSIEVGVCDTGIGMSEEAMHHIFDRFYREDKARSIGGNGLGLSIVKSIVDLHKGSIEVKSQKDVGSEFYVTLPIKQRESVYGELLEEDK